MRGGGGAGGDTREILNGLMTNNPAGVTGMEQRQQDGKRWAKDCREGTYGSRNRHSSLDCHWTEIEGGLGWGICFRGCKGGMFRGAIELFISILT